MVQGEEVQNFVMKEESMPFLAARKTSSDPLLAYPQAPAAGSLANGNDSPLMSDDA